MLVIFAQGNHAFMPGPTRALDQPVPIGFFSLDLPGSQGSHPGHSGMLQGDPNVMSSGRFSESDFNRLVSRAQNGLLKRSDVGAFIRENVERDPDATKFSIRASLKGVFATLAEAVPAGLELLSNAIAGKREGVEQRELLEALTSNARASNLIGSAGEFGLLFAFFDHKPGSVSVGDEPTVSVEDLILMFNEKQLPAGWETWPKKKSDWVRIRSRWRTPPPASPDSSASIPRARHRGRFCRIEKTRAGSRSGSPHGRLAVCGSGRYIHEDSKAGPLTLSTERARSSTFLRSEHRTAITDPFVCGR